MPDAAHRRLVTGLAVLVVVLVVAAAALVWLIIDRCRKSTEVAPQTGARTERTVWVTSAVSPPENEAASADGTPEPVQGTRATSQAPAFSYDVFQSPSGNILCQVGGQFAAVFDGDSASRAACYVSSFSGQAPTPNCQGGVTRMAGAAAIDSGGRAVQGMCAGGQPFGYRGSPSGLPVLDYGEATTNDQVTCASRENGMTCEDLGSGESFTVSRHAILLNGR